MEWNLCNPANKVSNKLRVFNTLNKVYATSVGMEIKNSAEFLKEEKVTISSNVREKGNTINNK